MSETNGLHITIRCGRSAHPEPCKDCHTTDDSTSAAYMEGRKAGEESRATGHIDLATHPNPYAYGSKDWQLWNLGWNYELHQNG